MVVASLILLHLFISAFCVFQTLYTIKYANGKVTRFDILMTIVLSYIPFGNIGLIVHNSLYVNWDWWNKEV